MVNVTVATQETVGRIKPMHAVNNGPIIARREQTRGNDSAFAAAGIPYARTHDSSFLSAYGGEHTVDIQAIFPDFDADVNDPASYDFAVTDNYLRQIQSVGTKIFYRLGSKIEHGIKKYNIFPPKDFQKWAEICEHIIAHYTEGWANGFHWDIAYWEIWNEPDLDADCVPVENRRCWCGTARQFYELYRTAALHLKKRFPHLKIGGPAMADLPPDGKWFNDFLTYITEGERVPLDFFSWHIYTKRVERVEARARTVRETLDRYGYTETESILNEWNYVRGWSEDFIYSIQSIISEKGAAFAASCMSACQNGSVDMLMYYDARPCPFNGLFDYYTLRPIKGYYPLYYFGKLYDMQNQVRAESDDSDVRVTAAEREGKVGIMISYFAEDDGAQPKEISLTVDRSGMYQCYAVDRDQTNVESSVEIAAGEPVTVLVQPQTVLFFELSAPVAAKE